MTEQKDLIAGGQQVAVAPVNPMEPYMMKAIETGNVDAMERAQAMIYRHEDRVAEREFSAAFTAFQMELPPVPKERKSKAHNTKYAPLDVLVDHCRPYLTRHGFSWRWEFNDSREEMRVDCILTHDNGHSKRNSMSAEPDDSGGKNKIQARASANSYLERYTFIGVTGVTIEGEDNDAGRPKVTVDELLKHNAAVRDLLPSIVVIKQCIEGGQLDAAVEAWHELSSEEMATVWRAPSNGGMLTTAERAVMKSDEWSAAKQSMGISDDPSARQEQ